MGPRKGGHKNALCKTIKMLEQQKTKYQNCTLAFNKLTSNIKMTSKQGTSRLVCA